MAPDRRELQQGSVSMLTEPVERPLAPYLLKKDEFYDRIIPDWRAQFKTVEQQHLYGDDFALYVREVTDMGAVVQDAVTGLFGFAFADEFEEWPKLDSLVYGAKCVALDNTIIKSATIGLTRDQVGIVFEWDEEAGEGYILPEEEQEAYQMLRVLRQDILWHDSRRLFPGQFVQFQTVLPSEAPFEVNEDKTARFALKVRCPEVYFSLRKSYASTKAITSGATDSVMENEEDETKLLAGDQAEAEQSPTSYPSRQPEEDKARDQWAPDWMDAEDEEWLAGPLGYVGGEETGTLPYVPASGIDKPVIREASTDPEEAWFMSGRQPPPSRSHPLLERFMQEESRSARAESPMWLWEPQMSWPKEEVDYPVIRRMTKDFAEDHEEPWEYIAAHEVAVEAGDAMMEPQSWEYDRKMEAYNPPHPNDWWGEKQQRLAQRKVARNKEIAQGKRKQAIMDAMRRSQDV